MTIVDAEFQHFTEDSITLKELFKALVSLMMRMDRVEIVAGELVNVALLPYIEETPDEVMLRRTLDELESFVRSLKDEITEHRRIREEMDFLNQPE